MYRDVFDFHKAFNLTVGNEPAFPSEDTRELRKRLLDEEVEEYLKSEAEDDLVNIARELADIIYIACGTAVAYGIPLDKIFKEVHNSNMAKLVNGKPIYREDGKVLKPEGWRPPNIQNVLYSKE